MKSDHYFYNNPESTGDLDNYVDSGNSAAYILATSNHYNLQLGELEEDLEDDFESEYDENDWEEEESSSEPIFDENEKEPGTFLM